MADDIIAPEEKPGLDIEKVSDSIASDLGLMGNDPEGDDDITPTPEPEPAEPAASVITDPNTPAAKTPEVTVRQPPKSWAKEKHELWTKVPPDAQEYFEMREKQMLDGLDQYKEHSSFGKQIRDVMQPFQEIINAERIKNPQFNEATAVRNLLYAHYRLTQGAVEQRKAAYEELGRNLGLLQPKEGDSATSPEVLDLRNKIHSIESTLTQREQQQLEEARTRAAKEVETFAADPAHPYFDEVSEDIAKLIRTGEPLDSAYEKAVWANSITRQKELARVQTEQNEQFKKKAKEDADKARKASGSNVRSRDTRKAPTEPLGTIDDTIHETHMAIKSRTH